MSCDCPDAYLHARAVSSAVMSALFAAMNDPAREEHWRKHADKLEHKFTTDHGEHYSTVVERGRK